MPVVVPDAGQELVEVGAGESPVEWPGGGVVVLLEGGDLVGELVRALEVVGAEQLALDDGEVNLDLVQPGGVDGRWTIWAFGRALLGRSAAAQFRCAARRHHRPLECSRFFGHRIRLPVD